MFRKEYDERDMMNEDPKKILDFLDEIGRLAPSELK